jgi:hypothetical protein
LADLARNGLTEPIVAAVIDAARRSEPIPPANPAPSTQTGLSTRHVPVLSQKIGHFSSAPIPQPDNTEPPKPVLPVNGHVTIQQNPVFFLADIPNGLDGFLTAEIIKQRLPITLTVDRSQSDYILTGNSLRTLDSHRPYYLAKDRNEGNVALINTQNKQVVWAGEAGDRSLLFSNLKRGDQRKLADRIISRMKKDLFHQQSARKHGHPAP